MIKVNIGGCNNHHPPNFVVRHMEGSEDYLLLITKTQTSFSIDGNEYETPPGTMVLLDRNVPSNYQNKTGEYINDWLHFDFEDELPCFEELAIVMNKPVTLYDISSVSLLVNMVISELHSKSIHKEQVIDSYMRILLYRLSDQMQSEKDSIRSQHIYKQAFQVSCMSDVINARIECAKFYLLRSDAKISAIALSCGYDSEMHFSRQFKKMIGMSPRDYRNSMVAEKSRG